MSESAERLAPTDRSYLRPAQHDALAEEKSAIEKTLSMDPALTRGMNRVQQQRRLSNIDAMVKREAAPVLEGKKKDAAVRRTKELREQIRGGMLSKAEMRQNPDGAVDRHVAWEKANADNITEYKNLMVALNPGSDEQDLCNIEKFRPDTPLYNMHNPQISTPDYHIPPNLAIGNVAEEGYFDELEKQQLDALHAMDAAGQIPDDMRRVLNLPERKVDNTDKHNPRRERIKKG